MDGKTIRIITFKREKEKWRMQSAKFMTRSGIKGYHVILIDAKKIPAYDTYKTQEK